MNLEEKYNEYLSQLRIKESDFHPIQRKENRNAFFAGATVVVLGLCNSPEPSEFISSAAHDISTYYKDSAMDYAESIIKKANRKDQ